MLVLILLCYGTEAYRTTVRWLHWHPSVRAPVVWRRERAAARSIRVYSCLIYNEARLYAMGVKAWRASFRTRMHHCP